MQRLKTRSQFQAAMSGGVIARTPHFVLHRLVLGEADVVKHSEPTGPGGSPQRRAPQALFVVPGCVTPQVWLGCMAPKRWARRSVTRHLIKRLAYAVAAECAGQLQAMPAAAYVVRLRAEFDRKQFVSASSEPLRRAVRAELQQLLAQAARRRSAGVAASEQAVSGATAPCAG